MTSRIGLASVSVLLSLLLSPAIWAQTVTNVRAVQLADKSVEVLYDLSGAADSGATMVVVFSSDGGATYSLKPASGALSGDVGASVANGINKRIVWDAKQTLPAGTFGASYRAQVTAESASSGTCCVLSCSASTNPTSQQTGSNIQFVASTSASSCSGTPTYSWTFGDGSTSASQNPTHAYAAAGTFVWSMTARAGDTSCASGGTVAITGGSGGPQEITVVLPGNIALVMIRIPAGSFQMGSPDAEYGGSPIERPIHRVTLTRDFYIGKYEVTQGQWKALVEWNPSDFNSCGDSCPAERTDPEFFIEALNAHLTATGQPGAGQYRLPTEAEWEYAARGKTQTPFSFSTPSTWGTGCAGFTEADQHMWWCGNAQGKTHPVGTREPNAYGLFDMHGNVWEECQDRMGDYTGSELVDPVGPSVGNYRVIRGGSWFEDASNCRSAVRSIWDRSTNYGHIVSVGFRVARW